MNSREASYIICSPMKSCCFFGTLISVNWDEESTELLQLIGNKWMTIRGFSSASAFMETYKKKHKKSVQKSKPLRKNLLSETDN